MRWNRTGDTGQIEDRRGMGGLGGGKLAGGGMGIIGLVLALLFGGNILGGGGSGFDVDTGLDPFDATSRPDGSLNGAPDPDKDLKDFVTFVVMDERTG